MSLRTKQTIIGTLVLPVLTLMTGCSKPAGGPAPAALHSPATATAASKLGDLTRFRMIAADVAKKVDAGELAAAKLRIKDLEITWDEAEAGLKPRSPADWHVLDKALDEALEALRADHPNASECRQKLSHLLQAFDSMH